jgi:hypothetical protein
MALEATQDPRHKPRMEMLTDRLLSWQRFGWGYPYGHEGGGVWNRRIGRNDLSNTQFAAMGLRAAHHAGIEIPPKAVKELIRETRAHQLQPRDSTLLDRYGKPVPQAGFSYEGPSGRGVGEATGSMTCAGIAILKICRDLSGPKTRPKTFQQIDESIALGLTWLGRRWSVEANPNSKSHHLYYLYAVERVGALLDTEKIGDHFWYLEGARQLVGMQKDDGNFGGDSETCFALLFLVRATGQGTGKPPLASVLGRYAMDDPASPVRFRAEGHSPLTFWVTALADGAVRRYGARPPRIERVEYVVDGDVVATVLGDPKKPDRNATWRIQHHFDGPGTFRLQARVHLVPPDGEVVDKVVESLPLEVVVKFLWPPWVERAAGWAARDRLTRPVTFSTSSNIDKWRLPVHAIDGLMSTYWLAAKDDAAPTVELKLKPSVKANAIVLHPPAGQESQRGGFDRPTRIEVRVNGKGPYVTAADPDSMRSTVVRLSKPERIKRLEIKIADRLPGLRWHGEVGFRDISLELEEVAPPNHVRDEDGLTTLAHESPQATIHYTLDGSVPTTDSPVYEKPFVRRPRTRLHAIAVMPEGATSRMLVADLRACDGYLHLDRSKWKIVSVSSEELPAHPIANAFDGDPRTFWYTRRKPEVANPPHEIVIDLGEVLLVEGVRYKARRDGTVGSVKDWYCYVGESLDNFGPYVGEGRFRKVKHWQTGKLISPVKGRYVKFVIRSEVDNYAHGSCAELDLQARRP